MTNLPDFELNLGSIFRTICTVTKVLFSRLWKKSKTTFEFKQSNCFSLFFDDLSICQMTVLCWFMCFVHGRPWKRTHSRPIRVTHLSQHVHMQFIIQTFRNIYIIHSPPWMAFKTTNFLDIKSLTSHETWRIIVTFSKISVTLSCWKSDTI